jgi:phosphoglycerate dehydrogenase-like enzyme
MTLHALIGPAPLAEAGGPFLDVLREAGFTPVYPDRPEQMNEAELLRKLDGVSASVAGSEPYTRRVLEARPGLRVIARVGVGYDAVDVGAATEHGVVVTITPGANQDAVAEHTFSLILALAKKVVPQQLALRAGGWPRSATLPLRGRTLGIIGLGRIGKAVAIRAAAFRMRVLACESLPDLAFVTGQGIALVPLERLLAESDFVSLHVPLTHQTQHMINRRTLALMKPTAHLVNTARGPLVSESDLYEALTTGRLAGAGMDVYEREPPGKSPLLELDNVVLTAHTAGVDVQSRDDMALSAARSVAALRRGDWPEEQIVNPDVRARFHW